MNTEQLIEIIGTLANERRQDNALPPVAITPDMPVLGESLGLDSLDLAAMVVDLEQRTGIDPFAAGIINFHTVGELAQLYSGS